MRTGILYVSLVLFSVGVQGQIPEYLSPSPVQAFEAATTPSGGIIGDEVRSLELYNDYLYYIYYRNPYYSVPNGAEMVAQIDGHISALKIRNLELEELEEIPIWPSSDSVYYYAKKLLHRENSELVIVGGRYALNTGNEFFIQRRDDQLHLLDHIELDLPIDETKLVIVDALINQNGNLVLSGFLVHGYLDSDLLLCEVTLSGEIVRLNSQVMGIAPIINNGYLNQLENGNYLISPFIVVDTAFNVISTQSPVVTVLRSPRNILLEGNRVLYTGKFFWVDPDVVYNSDAILVTDMDTGATDTLLNRAYDVNVYDFGDSDYFAFSATDTNHIYYAVVRLNQIYLYSVGIDGTENWSLYFDGTGGGLHPIYIVTMPDQGCLLLIRREEFANIPITGITRDVEYVRFDKDGQVVGISSALEAAGWTPKPILVYPNPVRDQCFFTFGSNWEELSIRLFDGQGRLLIEENIMDKQMNLLGLPVGKYAYQIFSAGKVIQSGQLVKGAN